MSDPAIRTVQGATSGGGLHDWLKGGPVFLYACLIDRVVDGDTYVARIDLGFRVWMAAPIRVYAFYAPELSAPGGLAAKAAAEQLITQAKTITVRSRKAESYQRVLADVFLDGVSIADTLIAQGHGTRTKDA